jgi:hypothetical protein
MRNRDWLYEDFEKNEFVGEVFGERLERNGSVKGGTLFMVKEKSWLEELRGYSDSPSFLFSLFCRSK